MDREAEAIFADEVARSRFALELTENIPVGTYTMILKPGETMARFSLMSSRFLELLGQTREEIVRSPADSFLAVHPEDREAWVELNRAAFESRKPFLHEVRLLVGGEVRWVIAESKPRALPNGDMVWEGVLIDITAQKTAQAELAAAHRALVASTAEQARTEERRRLLEDLHDGFASQLALARLQLRQGDLSLLEAERLLGACLDDLRLVVETLGHTEQNLNTALADFRHRLEGALRTVRWNVKRGACPRLDPRVVLQILRILQEGLHNALRHAGAETILVSLEFDPEVGLSLRLEDDGVGFDAAQPRERGGLKNLQRRADSLGARLQLASPSTGTMLALVVPMMNLAELGCGRPYL
jgi:PAS domain S-box-containing protein